MAVASSYQVTRAVVVASVAGATIGVQLAQTRILSALYYNHVVYVTVTIALLGFGISGVAASLVAGRLRNVEELSAWLAAGFAGSIPVCVGLASHLPALLPESGTLLKLLVSYGLLVIPFVFAGATLALVFMGSGKNANALYFLDLSASAVMVTVFVLLLGACGAAGFLWLCILAVAGAAIAQGRLTNSASRVALAFLSTLSVFVFVAGFDFVGQQPESYKTLGKVYSSEWTTETIEATQWSPIAKIDVWSDTLRDPVFGAPSRDPASTKMLTQDADAFAILWGPRIVGEVFEQAKNGRIVSALAMTYGLADAKQDALVIGVGGGVDIVTARAYGAANITGVEINPATTSLIQNQFSTFLQWPQWPGVQLVRAEGRHSIRSRSRHFDTIVMSGVDTFSALSSGAYVLSENYLYTTEAIGEYIDALKPGGVLAIYRWLFLQPRESLRLASIYLEAAHQRGMVNPRAHYMVVAEDLGWSGYKWAATFISKDPFTVDDVRRVLNWIGDEPRLSLVYVPKVATGEVQSGLEAAARKPSFGTNLARKAYEDLFATEHGRERQRFFDSYPYRVDPVFDDRPFFFEYYKPAGSTLATLDELSAIRGPITYYLMYLLLIIAAVVSVVAMIGPLAIFNRRGTSFAGAGNVLVTFASLGVGFMFFEVGSMQFLTLYLGDPMISLMVVLAGLLFFAGCGSLLSGMYWNASPLVRMKSGMWWSGMLILAWGFVMPHLTSGTLTSPTVIRITVVLVSLLPVGLALGVPFAAGLVYLSSVKPGAIPWAWGVNGVTSVLASVVAIIVAMKIGFAAIVTLAALTYAIGAIVATRIEPSSRLAVT